MSKATQVPPQTEEEVKTKTSTQKQAPEGEVTDVPAKPEEEESASDTPEKEETFTIKADGKSVKVPAKATLINLLKSTGGPKSLSHGFEEVGSHAPHGWVWNDEVLESKRPGQLIDLYQQMQAFNNE